MLNQIDLFRKHRPLACISKVKWSSCMIRRFNRVSIRWSFDLRTLKFEKGSILIQCLMRTFIRIFIGTHIFGTCHLGRIFKHDFWGRAKPLNSPWSFLSTITRYHQMIIFVTAVLTLVKVGHSLWSFMDYLKLRWSRLLIFSCYLLNISIFLKLSNKGSFLLSYL